VTKTNTTDAGSRDFNDSFTGGDSSKDKEYMDMLNNHLVWFDLEGIRPDALGYSVKITGGNQQRDTNKLKKKSNRGLGAGVSLTQGTAPLRKITSRQKKRSKEAEFFTPDSTQCSGNPKEIRIEIRRSTEVNRSEPDTSHNEEVDAWRSATEREVRKDTISNEPTISENSLKLSSSPPLEDEEERLQMMSRITSPLSFDLDTQPDLVPLSAIVYNSNTRNPRSQTSWLSPTSSPRRRPIPNLNTSQRWAVQSPQSSKSASTVFTAEKSQPETDSGFTMEIAKMRDQRNLTPPDGSTNAENGPTTAGRVHPRDDAV
jgi:hypothetical protein